MYKAGVPTYHANINYEKEKEKNTKSLAMYGKGVWSNLEVREGFFEEVISSIRWGIGEKERLVNQWQI